MKKISCLSKKIIPLATLLLTLSFIVGLYFFSKTEMIHVHNPYQRDSGLGLSTRLDPAPEPASFFENASIKLENLLATSLKSKGKNMNPSKNSTTTNPALIENKEYGTWVWISPIEMTQTYMYSIVRSAKEKGINVIYVTIDDYLDVHLLPEGTLKESRKADYSRSLESLIKTASENGVQIDVESGGRDWGEPTERYKGYALVKFALEYNASHPNYPIRGFQYDVEPYILAKYQTNKVEVLTNFLEFVDETASLLKDSNVRFSVAIPHFYDHTHAATPQVNFKGSLKHPFNHLLTIMDSGPSNSIIIMAYRNFFTGPNGVQELVNVEMLTASQGEHNTKIIITQETGELEPAYVTYFGLTRAYYNSQISLINTEYQTYSSFGGVAVHYLDTFLNLE